MKICPCKDCFKRKFLCHSMCPEYQQWKKERDDMMAKREPAGFTINEANKRKYWRNLKRERKQRYV